MHARIRTAKPHDASQMARIINAIIAIGGTTSHRRPFDERGIVECFLARKLGISCFVALDGTEMAGFQALEWSDPGWPGDNPLPADWALIATYVDPKFHRSGIGRRLFAQTLKAAKKAGVRTIDATIRKENRVGQAYYRRMGFQDYRVTTETVSKCLEPG